MSGVGEGAIERHEWCVHLLDAMGWDEGSKSYTRVSPESAEPIRYMHIYLRTSPGFLLLFPIAGVTFALAAMEAKWKTTNPDAPQGDQVGRYDDLDDVDVRILHLVMWEVLSAYRKTAAKDHGASAWEDIAVVVRRHHGG